MTAIFQPRHLVNFLRRHRWALFSFLFALSLPQVALGDDGQASNGVDGSDSEASKVVYEKKTVLDFTDVTLEGELARPEGSYVLNRQRARFDSLVQTRKDFVPELSRTIDEF